MVPMKKFNSMVLVSTKYLLKHYITWGYLSIFTVYALYRLYSMMLINDNIYRYLLENYLYISFSLPVLVLTSTNIKSLKYIEDLYLSKDIGGKTYLVVQYISCFLVLGIYMSIISVISFVFFSFNNYNFWVIFLPYLLGTCITLLYQIPLFLR